MTAADSHPESLRRSTSPAAPSRRGRLRSFHELMQRRVQRILLVSSLYDFFILSEEGQLHETLLSRFIELDLNQTPDLVQVSGGEEALALLAEDRAFDLVVSSLYAGDYDVTKLTRELRAAGNEVPVIALAYTGRELHEFVLENDTSELERVFLWQGDVRIFLAMVKLVEDRLNLQNDTGDYGVPVIIVVEDNPRYYSSFLPAIYSELYEHTRRLLSEDLNSSQKLMRMRARPKVLLCDHYEEAWGYFERYEDQVLGVISDVEFPRGGELDEEAGLELCRNVLAERADVRVVLQSSSPDGRALADEIGASFLLKGSPLLLQTLREVLVGRFGFGDFIFRRPDGSEVARAQDLKDLVEHLRTVPASTIAYHAERNHFSNWLKARTEFGLAERLRPQKVTDFADIEELRQHLLREIEEYRLERFRTVIADFDARRFEPSASITRIGDGSLGGKARGVAFANRILYTSGLDREYPGVDISVPPCVVLGTQVFDEFLTYGELLDFTMSPHSDEEILRLCVEAPFPRRAVADLRSFLQQVKYPVAVRSSGLLEDSLSQPFAGVYTTYMLPNNAHELDDRWLHLSRAIKSVYASVFTERAKAYLAMTSYRLEEEKMAVMIQELVGRQHDSRFYPDFSGVARSHNFYPQPGHSAEDGVAAVALGLGQTVVGGDPCLQFCPRFPRQTLTFSSVDSALKTSQRELHALDLARAEMEAASRVHRYPLEVAEADGVLAHVGSTFIPGDNRIVEGISRDGVRLVSFAQVLRHGSFPLAEILCALLERCTEASGTPVEIEFAGNLPRDGEPGRFAFLQMRPLAISREQADVEIGEIDGGAALCRSTSVLGNGRVEVRDVVFVDVRSFERLHTPEVAQQVAHFDAVLRREGRPYVLIGLGRWGSSDPSLGIPVTWTQISGARVIVESGFRDIHVAPSQGTHFFQNLSSASVGYFTVNPDLGEGALDWEWLGGLSAEAEGCVRHASFDEPLVVLMDGRAGEGVILKPGEGRV